MTKQEWSQLFIKKALERSKASCVSKSKCRKKLRKRSSVVIVPMPTFPIAYGMDWAEQRGYPRPYGGALGGLVGGSFIGGIVGASLPADTTKRWFKNLLYGVLFGAASGAFGGAGIAAIVDIFDPKY